MSRGFASSKSTEALILLALLVCAVGGGFSVLTSRADGYRHSGEVRLALGRLVDGIVDAEAGARGYLLTGNPIFLRRYDEARATWQHHVDDLRRLTSHEDRQEQRLDEVQRLIAQEFDELAGSLRLPTTRDDVAAAELLHGKVTMEAIRRLEGDMQAEQERIAATREDAARSRAHAAFALFAVSSLVHRRRDALQHSAV